METLSDLGNRFDSQARNAGLEIIPNFRWCLNPRCSSGQIHESASDGPIFQCRACGFKACVVHNRRWHRGETCAQFDERNNTREKRAEEEASEELVLAISKECPSCAARIQKNDGCDHMTCRFSFIVHLWSIWPPFKLLDNVKLIMHPRHKVRSRVLLVMSSIVYDNKKPGKFCTFKFLQISFTLCRVIFGEHVPWVDSNSGLA
jgi:hypothetical protein